MIEQLKARLPDWAKDLRINLGIIGTSAVLTPQQAWGAALAAAVTAQNAEVVQHIAEEAAAHLSADAVNAAKGAAAIMGMNNIYYRFNHMMGDDYAKLPARLRMQIIGRPGVDHLDFELWCLAASAITGCEACVKAHESTVRAKGGSAEHVQDAVRIAAVIHGVAITCSSTSLPGTASAPA